MNSKNLFPFSSMLVTNFSHLLYVIDHYYKLHNGVKVNLCKLMHFFFYLSLATANPNSPHHWLCHIGNPRIFPSHQLCYFKWKRCLLRLAS